MDKKTTKVFTLIAALNDVLEDSGLDEMVQDIGEEMLNQCLDLRAALRKSTSGNEDALATPPSSSQLQPDSQDAKNIPKLMSGLSLTPWKSSEIPTVLPPLPEVLDETLKKAAFIHAGTNPGKITELNYERLEWIGDVYIELAATLLISQTFPFHTVGKCAQIRESLVKNVTLADYARKYGFDKRASVPEAFTPSALVPAKEHLRVKVLGDIFEAYVAAVVLSDSTYGLSRAVQWLKDLWGMDLLKEIIREEKSPATKLLSPIWDLGRKQEVLDQQDLSLVQVNPKTQLQQAVGCHGVKITYRDSGPERKDKNNRLPIFTVGVYIDGWGEKDKQLGIGSAHGKKEAGSKAAEIALNNKKMMKVYMDKKKVYEAQKRMEAEALAKLESA
jgi:ribonuclease-3